jgi:hypothetical protein
MEIVRRRRKEGVELVGVVVLVAPVLETRFVEGVLNSLLL